MNGNVSEKIMENVLSTVEKQTCLDSMLNLLIQKRADKAFSDQRVCDSLEIDKAQFISQEKYAKFVVVGNNVSQNINKEMLIHEYIEQLTWKEQLEIADLVADKVEQLF